MDRTGHVKITDFGFAKRYVHTLSYHFLGFKTDELGHCAGRRNISRQRLSRVRDMERAWIGGRSVYLPLKCCMGLFESVTYFLARFPPFYDDTPFGIYEKILAGKLVFSSTIDPYAKDLVKRLLTADRTKRLGNLKNGSIDVKNHRWFKGVDWDGLLARKIGAPIIPKVGGLDDTRNFESYAELTPAEASAYNVDGLWIDGF